MFDDNYTDEEWEQFMSDFVSMYSMQMKDDTVCFNVIVTGKHMIQPG